MLKEVSEGKLRNYERKKKRKEKKMCTLRIVGREEN